MNCWLSNKLKSWEIKIQSNCHILPKYFMVKKDLFFDLLFPTFKMRLLTLHKGIIQVSILWHSGIIVIEQYKDR